jgi:hypothetical protein
MEKVEIHDCLKASIHEFACQESAYIGEDVERFKEKYLFECLHEIFSVEFLVNLHERMERLVEKHRP